MEKWLGKKLWTCSENLLDDDDDGSGEGGKGIRPINM
jgi:hypothetical protein